MTKLLLLTLLIIACGPRPPVATKPTVTLSVAGQQFVNAQNQNLTELQRIEATAAAEIEQVKLDLNERQADIDMQNAVAKEMIPVLAQERKVAALLAEAALMHELITLTVQIAHAQAEGEIIISDARLKIEADQNNVSFGHWLMTAAVFAAAAIAVGFWYRLWRVKGIEDQQHTERGLIVAKQESDADIAVSRALVVKYEAQTAQAKAWQQAMTILSDGTAFLLVPNRDGLPEKHWVNREPIIVDIEPTSAPAISNTHNRRQAEIERPIHIDEIDLGNSSKLQLQLINFITAIIRRYDEYVNDGKEEVEGVAQTNLLRYSHLPQYGTDAWTLLTDMLVHNGLILKVPKKFSRVHPDSQLKNLGDLLQLLTNGRVLQVPNKPTSPPSGMPQENLQQQETTVKTAKTGAEQPNGAVGRGQKFHAPLLLQDGTENLT